MLRILIRKQNQKKQDEKGMDTRKLLKVMNMSVTLIVVMISQVFAYVQIHQIACILYVQISVYQLYLNKAVKKKNPRKTKTFDPTSNILSMGIQVFNISCEDFLPLWGQLLSVPSFYSAFTEVIFLL